MHLQAQVHLARRHKSHCKEHLRHFGQTAVVYAWPLTLTAQTGSSHCVGTYANFWQTTTCFTSLVVVVWDGGV